MYSDYFSVKWKSVTKIQITQQRFHRNKLMGITVNIIFLWLNISNMNVQLYISLYFSNKKMLLSFDFIVFQILYVFQNQSTLTLFWTLKVLFGALVWSLNEKKPIIVKQFSHIVRYSIICTLRHSLCSLFWNSLGTQYHF